MSEEQSEKRKKQKPGILRLDINKPRRSSGSSVEFRNQPELLGERDVAQATPSPQLSVRWAYTGDSSDDQTSQMQNYLKARRDGTLRKSPFLKSKRYRKSKSLQGDEHLRNKYLESLTIDSSSPFDLPGDDLNSEEEDYSLTLSAVMQRRASIKGHRKRGVPLSPRRASTQMGAIIRMNSGDRRSSVYTTSSETGLSLGDGTNQQDSTKEQIFENIKLHKEVLQSVKLQPWSMRRKLRIVRQAKEYIARHEGALQERFAMSRSTRDLWARFKILLAAKWQHYRREMANISTVLIPWELRIKEIESHFGSVVASYFTFLRWLFWVNIVIAIALSIFVVIPEFLATQVPPQKEDHRKEMLPEEKANATRLMSIWDFEGFLKYSPIFYGYYSDYSGAVRFHYELPLAYFLTGLLVYIYSFWATLRKMAENSRMSKLSSKDDECVFSWKLFTGWDFMIGHAETAHNRIASVVLGFKEALLEEAEKKKDTRNWKIIVLRVIVNFLVLLLLIASAYAVIYVVNRSTEDGANDTYWRRNEITVVITAISFFFPMFFEVLGLLESYHPRKQLRMQLARIMALNLLNLYSLIFALFDKISQMNKTLIGLKENITHARDIYSFSQHSTTMSPYNLTRGNDFDTILPSMMTDAIDSVMTTIAQNAQTNFVSFISENATQCYRIAVNCSTIRTNETTLITSLLAFNITATILPKLLPKINTTNITDHLHHLPSVLDRINLTKLTSTTEFYFDNFTDYSTETSSFGNFTIDLNSTEMYDGNKFNQSLGNDTTDEDGLSFYDELAIYLKNLDDEITESPNLSSSQLPYHSSTPQVFDTSTSTESSSSSTTNQIETTTEFYDYYDYYDESTTATTEKSTSTVASIIDEYADEYDDDYENEYKDENYPNDEYRVPAEYEKCYITICKPIEKTTTTPTPTQPPFTLDYDSQSFSSSIIPNDSSINSIETTISSHVVTDFYVENTTEYIESLTHFIGHMDHAKQLELRKLCWETMFGQELVKLTVMDLVATVVSIISMDFLRALFVRFCNKFWCWDLEKRYPKYGDFKIAENILHLVNNQGQVWMGMFFSPGLAILNLIKLVVIMYMRSWAVLACNVPHEVVFRASRSNNFYLALLLTMLFLCVLPVGYAIVWLRPSWHCGPFSKELHRPLDYIASPSTVIPLLLLLILIIYYLVSLTGALREANQDLKIQLRRERTEERRKMMKVATTKEEDVASAGNVIDRWRKVLGSSSPLTPSGASGTPNQEEEKSIARKEFLARIMKKALRKGSNTSDDDSHPAQHGDDETDTEQNESLPHDDIKTIPKSKRSSHRKSPTEDGKPAPSRALRQSITRARDGSKKPEVKDASGEHPRGRYKIETPASGSLDTNKGSPTTQEHEDQLKVVSERRKSILRRQGGVQEAQRTLPVQQLSVQPTSSNRENPNYKVINEKSLAAEKKSKLKIRSKPEPEVFTFDEDDVTRKQRTAINISDEDNTSYREAESDKDKSLSIGIPDSPSSRSIDTFWNRDGEETYQEITDIKKYSPPKYATILRRERPKDEGSKPQKKVETVKTVAEPVKLTVDKPKMKFSIMSLVREVVHTRRQPDSPTSPLPENSSIITISSEIISPRPSPTPDTAAVAAGSSGRRKGSQGSVKGSKRRPAPQHDENKPKPKRQDSQTSIWSDNIPVITVTKTTSDECILESHSDTSPAKKPSKDDKPELSS